MHILNCARPTVMTNTQRSRTITQEGATTMQKIGYGLIGVGILALAIWAGVQFLSDPEVGTFVKVTIAAIVTGVLVLLGTVLRDRIRASRNDKLKGVQR